MIMSILVDVIIPVYNAAETIEDAVFSVFNQKTPNHSVLIEQQTDNLKRKSLQGFHIDVCICCHDDGSSDGSLSILQNLKEKYHSQITQNKDMEIKEGKLKRGNISVQLLIGFIENGRSLGAGAARNRAVRLRNKFSPHKEEEAYDHFLCMLDADDTMHEHRIAHQVSTMLALSPTERKATLLGSTFNRIPLDSTWHYTQWANSLDDERLKLEMFREVTIIQPSWMISKTAFNGLGGYIESSSCNGIISSVSGDDATEVYRLIHPEYDNETSLRLAEDLRFYYAHLTYPYNSEKDDSIFDTHHIGIGDEIQSCKSFQRGLIKRVSTKDPLLTYRHREGQSQSSSTPRKLLLRLRVKAFVDIVIQAKYGNQSTLKDKKSERSLWSKGFVIWGAGRDGKQFFNALPEQIKELVRCFADVDERKIAGGYYVTSKSDKFNTKKMYLTQDGQKGHHDSKDASKSKRKGASYRIPIVHFSLLARDKCKRQELITSWLSGNIKDVEDGEYGQITKQRPHQSLCDSPDISPSKARKRPKPSFDKPRQLHGICKKDELQIIECLPNLPVVVCVAMYRTSGVLERNVQSIGRIEGNNLWHFS